MNRKSDSLYYSERLQAERKAVAAATCEQARAAHQALADHYAACLGDCTVEDPLAEQPRPFLVNWR